MTATQAKTAASRETATGHEVGAESQSHRARPASSVPGPRAPRLVQSWLGINHPLAVRLWARRRFGPIFRTNDAIVGEMFHVADRDLVAEMFKWKPAEYNVGEPREIMEPALGSSSMLLLDGDRHLRMRKLMLPPFHGEAIATYRELIEQITNREVDRWRPGDTIRARGVAQTITMEVIIRAVFGISDPERVAELKRLLPRLASINPLLGLTAARRDLGPRSPWGAFLRARERADEMIYEEIERRRRANADGDRHDDILALLLSARDEEGQPLSDKELRDELITILLAGHETTATSIAWAFERLLRTPQTLERLTDEVKHGDGEEYLEAVIKETLRVRPVVIDVFRAPTEPIELGGYLFQPRTKLAASIGLVQYDPEIYPQPEAFRPERFLEGAPESYTWVPFGGGVRRCIGAAFAQLEMKVVIATILRRVRLRAKGRSEKRRFRGVVLLPSRGGEAVVEDVDGTGSEWRAQVTDVLERDPIRVARAYSRLAPIYEVWARLTESDARRRVLELLELTNGEDVLEVAVGTGVQLAEIARRNPNGHVAGVDLAEGMLAATRRRLAAQGLSNVELKQASALDLPYPADSFDLLVNGYMLDLIPTNEIPRVLAEFKRVLRPGGRLVLSNMTVGDSRAYRIWQALYERGVNLTANCRGVLAAPVLEQLGFAEVRRETMTKMGFPTEIVTASKPLP